MGLWEGKGNKEKDQDDLIERQCWTPNTELEKGGRWGRIGGGSKKIWSEKQLKYNMKISNTSP